MLCSHVGTITSAAVTVILPKLKPKRQSHTENKWVGGSDNGQSWRRYLGGGGDNKQSWNRYLGGSGRRRAILEFRGNSIEDK